MFGIFGKGLAIGILASAPMGPIGMLCIQRTLNKGRWHGFVTGLGATLSDVIYATLVALGMGVVINFIEANQAPLQVLGSLVLFFFGLYLYNSNPVKGLHKQKEKKMSFTQDFVTSFFLTFSNVLIVLFYIGLYARFGFVLPDASLLMLIIGIVGVAIGAIVWWFLITYLVSKLKKWFNVRGIWVLNRVIGTVIIALSIIGLLSIVYTSYIL